MVFWVERGGGLEDGGTADDEILNDEAVLSGGEGATWSVPMAGHSGEGELDGGGDRDGGSDGEENGERGGGGGDVWEGEGVRGDEGFEKSWREPRVS